MLTTLRPEIAGQVGRVAAPTAAAVTLTLTDG
ncbi:cell division protein FtsQ, partial [Mycolicibacterium insubricum]|nr:cell division protein FtsQ [Mycolicibacterium insubricum]